MKKLFTAIFSLITIAILINLSNVTALSTGLETEPVTKQKAVAETISLSSLQERAADVNQEGYVSIDDATLIQKYVAELITSF